jgi:zinc transporter
LRGVNLNAGQALEDMLALRMWASDAMLITLRSRPIQASRDVEAMVKAGEVPGSTGGLVAALANALTNRMEPEIAAFDETCDGFEDEILDPAIRLGRATLAEFRRKVLALRRYIVPQREALSQLVREGSAAGFFSETDVLYLRESVDRVTRLAEDLDAIRERSIVLQEQVMEERSDMMNQRLFVLSILSAIFLPISFVTGLFGVNVGGIPGVDSPIAFGVLIFSLAVATGIMLAIFRWRRWI